MKKIPVLLLTGYLGSGKTTLLNRILANERGIKFAVIVNDIGEVNIDADLIAREGVVNSADDSLVPLQNGCICCTLKMDLVKQIEDLVAMKRFDYIVIEASGICEPEPIAQTICSIPAIIAQAAPGSELARRHHGDNLPVPQLDCIVTVVDALRLRDEFGSGESLKRENIDEEDIENLIIQQIEFCNIILLNKADEVSRDELERIKCIIRAIQPRAEIIETNYADVDLSRIINTGMFDFNKVATSAAWIHEIEKPADEHHHEEEEEHHHHHHHDHDDHDDEEGHEHCDHEHGVCHCHHHHHDHEHGEAEEYGIGTMVYYRRDPFNFERFDAFAARWPKNIIRAKGICYFSNNTPMSYLFEQAGKQKTVKETGQWYATMPADELEDMLISYPDLRRDWKEPYGDRMIKLVLIGQHLDRHKIEEELDKCLDHNVKF